MSRPIKYGEKTVSKTFRIPASLNRKIQKKAIQQGVSWSEYVIKALDKGL